MPNTKVKVITEKYAHFQTVCSPNYAYIVYFPRNASIFTCSHRNLKNFPGRETPDSCLYTGVLTGEENGSEFKRMGLKCSSLKKKRKGGKREERGKRQGAGKPES